VPHGWMLIPLMMSFCQRTFCVACHAVWLMLLFAQAGCVSGRVPVPQMGVDDMAEKLQLPRQVTVTQTSKRKDRQAAPADEAVWQVVVQPEGDALRWLRLDLLGVPDARSMLRNGRWYTDGFIAPNRQAQELFAALLFAWSKSEDLAFAYGTAQSHCNLYDLPSGQCKDEVRELKENHRIRWKVGWPAKVVDPDSFYIVCEAKGLVWQVRPLAEAP